MKKAIVPLGIILLVVFGVFMYINRFTIFHVSDVEGYVFNTNNIAVNLSSGITENSEEVTFENVKVSDTIYQSGKRYYIGEESKKNVNLDYPIISEDKASVYVLNDSGKYIDENFVKETSYKNSIFTEGYLYNGSNLERTGEDKYLFLELNNGIFVNLVEINVRRYGEDNIIPVNSFIYFEQSFLRYYTLENKAYKYYSLPNISDSTKTFVGDDEYSYYDLLLLLEVLSPKEDKIEEVIEEIELDPKPPAVITPSETTPAQGLVGGETPSGGHIVEEEYVKPVVSLTKTEAGVYSFRGDLSIYDPTNRIYKTPTLEYKSKGLVYLRNSFSKAARIETIGLMPNTTYEVTGYYYYHDEFSKKMKNTFYTGEFTTGDISSLEALNLTVKDIEPDISKVKIDTIKINNKLTDEVLKGLKIGNVIMNRKDGSGGDINIGISAGDIKKLIKGEVIDFKTDTILKSNTGYDGRIQMKDLAGNTLVVNNDEFEFTTLKSPPTANIYYALSKNFTVADVTINVDNPDEMIDPEYYYEVRDANNKVMDAKTHNGNGTLKDGENKFQLKNLYAAKLYTIRALANYTDAKGNRVTGHLMDTEEFISWDVSRLGSIDFTVDIVKVDKTSAEIKMKYTNYDEENPVFELLYPDIEVVITDKKNANNKLVFEYNKEQFKNFIPFTVASESCTAEEQCFVFYTDTVYQIDVYPKIVSGEDYFVATTLSNKEFQSLKKEAKVHIKNGFVSSGYIDFDVCVEDLDGTIKDDKAVVNLVANEKIAFTQTINTRTNCDAPMFEGDEIYDRISAHGLEERNYELQVIAKEYNIGHLPSSIQSNVSLRTEVINAKGTVGQMKLNNLINMVNYKTTLKDDDGSELDEIVGVNLFDISNNTRWKSAGHQNTSDLKEIKIEDNVVVLEALKGWRQYSYYLPELEGKAYVLSFEYNYQVGTKADQKICLSFSDASQACHENLLDATGEKLTPGDGKFEMYIRPVDYVATGGIGKYLTFYINENTTATNSTKLTLKKIKIEIGTGGTATSYTSFGSLPGNPYKTKYAGRFYGSFDKIITDAVVINSEEGSELRFNEHDYSYVIRYFKDGVEQPQMQKIIEYNKVDPITNKVTTFIDDDYVITDLEADETYEARLSIKTILTGSSGGGSEDTPEDPTGDVTEDGEEPTPEEPEGGEDPESPEEPGTGDDEEEPEEEETTEDGARYYDLKTVEFTTEAETRTITTVDEFLSMHAYGYYIVGADLDFANKKGYSGTFQGSLDFQGHKVTTYMEEGPTSIIQRIGGGAVVKNIDFHVNLNENELRHGYYGLVYENYGLISNLSITVDSSSLPYRIRQKYKFDEEGNQVLDYEYSEETGHEWFGLLGESNFGTIENFVIDLKANVYCKNDCALGPISNNGTMKNGYVTGKNIKAGYTADGTANKNVGVFARNTNVNSKIENVYSLIDIELSNKLEPAITSDFIVGNIVATATDAEISNVIIVDPRLVHQGESEYQYSNIYRNLSKDVSFNSYGNSMVEDVYYIGNYTYANSKTQDATIAHLSNESFMSARLNSEKKFNTGEAWQSGTFPILNWPNGMPAQRTVSVPKRNTSQYLKVLSVDSVIQDKTHHKFKTGYEDYFARVEMSIYNPNNLKLVGFNIEGIGSPTEDSAVVVHPTFGTNSDKIEIVEIYIKEPEIFQTNYKVRDIYINNSGTDNKWSGTTKSCNNGKIVGEYDCATFPTLTLDLYKYVDTLEQITSDTKNKNFRLTQNLDFAGQSVQKLNTVSGVIDGDGHTISNLTSNNCFINTLSGTIKNLNVETYTVNHSTNKAGYGSFICESTTGAIVDNVHLNNVETTAGGATIYVSGLIAKSTNTKVRNSSVKDITIRNIEEMKGKDAYAGGLIAHSTRTNVNNSFVRKINFNLESYVVGDSKANPPIPDTYGVAEYKAAGGLIGQMVDGLVENVYTTGTINTKFGTAGGIVGHSTGYIRSAITKVNIYSSGDKLGGILGFNANDDTNVAAKTLVLGEILSSADNASMLDRTSGNQITSNQNFAWNRQSINSVVNANTKMEELLDETELGNPVIYNSKIGLSEFAFAVSTSNYAKKYGKDAEGYEVLVDEDTQYATIPKLLHSTTGRILNNQTFEYERAPNGDMIKEDDTEIHYVELFSLLQDPTVTYMSTNKTDDFGDDFEVENAWDGEYVNVTLFLKNPNNLSVQSISIEDMDLIGSVQSDKYEDTGLVSVTFSAMASLNKNYDSYRITGIRYREPNKTEVKEYFASIKLTIPFYGRIKTADDWQSIKAGTYQNFVLAEDIDLSKFNNNDANINISFNKLIGIDVIDKDTNKPRAPIIKNITRTGLGAGSAVISTIQSEIRNISFENISLTTSSTADGTYFGIIKTLNGKMTGSYNQDTHEYQRMHFNHITLEAPKLDRVGIIAYNSATDIHYIGYKDVYVKGEDEVGGFIGYSLALDKTDIVGEDIYVYASANYAGGLIGQEPEYWSKTFTFTVTLTGVYVFSNNQYAGGAYGRGSGLDIVVIGKDTYFRGDETKPLNYVYSKNYYTGGVVGRFSSCYPYNNYAYNMVVVGQYYVGGVAGYRYNAYNMKAVDTHVDGYGYVGGISGWSGYTVTLSTFAGGSVKGHYYVGGISGGISSGAISYCHVGQHNGITTVTGENSNSYGIGGLVGYVNTGANTIRNNTVSANVKGSYAVGGLVGFLENRNESKTGSRHYVYDNIIGNSAVEGTHATKPLTGGLIGKVERNFPYNYIYDNFLSVTVRTPNTSDYSGYIIGGSEYYYDTAIKNEEGEVTGSYRTDFTTTKGDKFVYTESNGTIITKATGIRLYENSTLNNLPYAELNDAEKITGVATYAYDGTDVPARDNIQQYKTYNNISTIQRATVDAGKTEGLQYYPMSSSAQDAIEYPNSIAFNLPAKNYVPTFGGTKEDVHILPDFKVYAVGVDKINIEFEYPDPQTRVTVNGTSYKIDQSVFTFYYDFKEDFEIKLSDDFDSKVIKVTAEEVKNGITVIGQFFYYLKDGEVITNNVDNEELEPEEKEESDYESTELPTVQQSEIEVQEESEAVVEETTPNFDSSQPLDNNIVSYAMSNLTSYAIGTGTNSVKKFARSDTEDNTVSVVDNATNIYGEEILLEDKSIYNLYTGEIYENNFENLTLVETEPLHEYTYANQRIETFYFHTLIDGKRVDKQVYVKNGQIEIIATELSNKKNTILVDNYNDKNYVIYLGEDGKLYSIKDDIEFPKGFKNINIRSISSNANNNSDLLFVEYNDGSYTVFNYRTGQLIMKQSDENISLEDYIKQYLELSFDSLIPVQNGSYQEAKNLVEKLNQKPLSSFANEGNAGGTLSSRKYSIMYNPGDDKYYVYEIPGAEDNGAVALTTSLDKTVDSIIDDNPAMIEYYRNGEGEKVQTLPAILIVLGITLGITGAVLSLGKNVRKQKKLSE